MSIEGRKRLALASLLLASSSLSPVLAQDDLGVPSAPTPATRVETKAAGAARSSVGPGRQAAKAKMMAAMQLQSDPAKSAEAESQLRSVIAGDATYAAPYYNLAVLQEREGEFAEAIQNYRNFLQYGQSSRFRVEAKLRLAIVEQLAKLGPVKVAQPNDAPDPQYAAALLAATAFREDGLLPQALVQSQRAAQLDGTRWEPLLVLAEVQNELGENQNALASYDKAKLLAPQSEKAQIDVLRGGAALAVKQDELATLGLEALKRNDRSAKDLLFQAWALSPQREEIGFIAAVKAVGVGDLPLSLAITQVLCGSTDSGLRVRAQALKFDILKIEKLQLEPIKLDIGDMKSAQLPSELTEDAYENGENAASTKAAPLDPEKSRVDEEVAASTAMIAAQSQLAEGWKRAAETVESFGQVATYQRERQMYHQGQERAWRARKDIADLLAVFLSE